MSAGSGSLALYLVDGKPAESLPLSDRGLLLGDGLFETLRIDGGRPLLMDLHLDRLRLGCAALDIPFSATLLARQLEELLRLAPPQLAEQASLRITLTRGDGQRGYAAPDEPRPRLILALGKLESGLGEQFSPALLPDPCPL